MLQEGARYHVTARANRKEMILDQIPIKELFLSVVQRAKQKYRFRIENFCIMGNHFHFIIQPLRGECLSVIMRWIMSVFAMAYNKILCITGHVWGSRFFSRILAALREFLLAFEYIDDNPPNAWRTSNSLYWRYSGLGHDLKCCREILDGEPVWRIMLSPQFQRILLKNLTL